MLPDQVGIEMTHPDKGSEMFRARENGCYGMWVLADRDNDAALATYRKRGGGRDESQVILSWDFEKR